MNKEYFDFVNKLEEIGVSDQYMIGWQEGYQGSPKVEEQRLTDDYEAGYEDGSNKKTDSADKFKKN
tara:strand:- start:573 stop:770 length:198 start_codon:yes stop_codon:yes gene_type:complete